VAGPLADPGGTGGRRPGRGHPQLGPARLSPAGPAAARRGEVPPDHAALLDLPGVGDYTAAAVASFAFRQRHPVLDTNVRRVLARTVSGTAYPPNTLTAAETALATGLVPDEPAAAARWAVAVMELGALVCTARAPRCADCPVADLCRWRADGHPPYDGPARRGQAYAGTDRYVRGLLLAVLRAADGPVSRAALTAAVGDDLLRDRLQRDRCLDALVADGLVEPLPRNRFRLPT
jgi:A/G-specific adenine glycosylase